MIARHWRGIAKVSSVDLYLEHLRSETLPALANIPGFVDASILRRDVAAGVEFLVVTRWASLDAIRAFAGADVEQAVVPDQVDAMMVEWDRAVKHYDEVRGSE